MQPADINNVAARARAGDVRALATLGRRLLFGDGVQPDFAHGLACLRDAAQRGDGEAPTVLASVAAHGVLEPRNPHKALDLLQQGAERGWAPAQAQLRHLAQGEGSDWAALRKAVDLTGPKPTRRALSDNPHIRVLEGFATHAECDWLIATARQHLHRAMIYQGTADLRSSDVRTNTEADLMVALGDVATAFLLDRVAAAAGVTRSFCEVPKVLHYEPGQHFGRHGDFFQTTTPSLREEIARSGQRVATFLIYLNDGYEGGETDFLEVGVRYKGKKGDALLFVNVDDAGAPDMKTLHAGLPPTSGEKWVLSQWVRGKAINAYMTPGGEREQIAPNWRDSV